MKLPLAVEAGVADELRNWLALELEQLNDAFSTNQFAHHVVTILLHEDLDIEDEPLSSGDDFLKDIFSMRQTKTKEKQKKAAVDFLRSAVCSGNHTDADIQMVVEELMQKIDATKSKMQSRKTKKSLLTALTVNQGSPVKKAGVKKGATEELYNEAFPSLCGEESSQKEAVNVTTSTNFAWNKSPGCGKENQKKQIRRRIGSRCTWLFRSPEEARACDIARETAAVVLEDLSFSTKEAMEVWAPSHTSSTPFTNPPGFCWTSAFSRTNLMTKPFSPSTMPLHSVQESMEPNLAFKITSPVIVGDRANTSYPCCPHVNSLSNWKEIGFSPITHKAKWEAKRKRKINKKEQGKGLSADSEVKFYFFPEESEVNDLDTHEMDVPNFDEEIEGLVSFPSHYGSYWQDLISKGAISLYPSFDAEQDESQSMRSSLSNLLNHCPGNDVFTGIGGEYGLAQRLPVNQYQSCGERETSDNHTRFQNDPSNGDCLSLCTDNFNEVSYKGMTSNCDIDADDDPMLSSIVDLHLSQDEQNAHVSTHVKLHSQDYEYVNWDSPWHTTEWNDINQEILAGLMGTKKREGNPYLPPQLASCVKSEHSQFLQSAFVNAYFSSPHVNVYSQAWKPASTHQKTFTSLYEHQFIRPKIWPVELIKGSTCSNWLENNCKLGLLCPFSHPREFGLLDLVVIS
ncbi:hypothetical protein ElyMa_006336800 [Elysia marginata]|uniref:C3H1-type domain-containing protein n=1 Tax=Elysia marginata TaxID=1093978 RepID=A0AAV4HKJ6_9GAST|nr:hypothetical protein ElyMa_006336800 [Elysia marginata]